MNKEQKKFLTMIGAATAALAVLTALIIFLTRDREPEAVNSSYSLSEEDKRAIKLTAEAFVKDTGSFGLNEKDINSSNLFEISNIISSTSKIANSHWRSREDAYLYAADNYLSANGPLVYDSSVYAGWLDSYEKDNLINFKVTEATATVNDKASITTYSMKQVPNAFVKVDFNSVETKRIKASDDEKWDGTYSVMGKNFSEEISLSFVKTDKGWRVNNVSGLNNAFLLATWKNANDDYSSSQFDFKKVATIKSKVK